MRTATLPVAGHSDSRLKKRGVRLTVVEDLGGGLFITRLSARLARLAWVREQTRLQPGVYQLTTLHGVCVARSRDPGRLRMLAVALSQSAVWADIASETDPDKACTIAAKASPEERKMLISIQEYCQEVL